MADIKISGEGPMKRASHMGATFLAVVITSIATAALTSMIIMGSPEPANNVPTGAQSPAPANGGERVATAESKTSHEQQIVDVVAASSMSVVSVIATQDLPVIERYFVDPFGDNFFGGPSPFQIPRYRQNGTEPQEVAAGTGFIVTEDGYVLTNRHVVDIEEADFTIIFSDDTRVSAEVIAMDSVEDIAVLKIDREGLVPLVLGDSDAVRIGQSVIAIGNALGEFSNTVSVGVVSGLNRRIIVGGTGTAELIEGAIQTDAAINPGNSGGPLLNLSGEVIGMNTAIVSGSENIGFAIPIDKAAKALADVQEFGHISRPFIGVRFVPVDAVISEARDLPNDYGALILGSSDGREPGVLKGSPADEAGLREGDVILEIDGVLINADNRLNEVVQSYVVGDVINVKLYSNGETRDITLTLADREILDE